MKKIFLALILVSALSLPAFATDFTIVSGAVSSDLWYSETHSDDVTSEDVTEYYLKDAPYKFATIAEALEFANSPSTYLGLTLAEDPVSFSNAAIKLQTADNTITSIIGGNAITFNNYASVTTISISPSTAATMTLYTPGSGRHFVCNSTATVTFENLIFEGSNSTGGVEVSSGTVNFNTVNFQNINMSSANGGAVSITNGTVNFSDCGFTGNTAGNGGAISITGGTVSFSSGITFTNNTASTSGGAVLLNSSGVTLTLSEITFTSNKATNGYGGAIAVGASGGSLSVTDCTFTTNTAGTSGGAVSIQGSGTFAFESSSRNAFISNQATSEGGAIYIDKGSSLTFSGTNEFSGNTAGTNGGALAYNVSLTSSLSDLAFTGNTAVNGGAVSISNGTVTFTNSEFTSNIADNGGAVAVLGGSATFSDGVKFLQHDDSSITNGGAIYAATNRGTVTVESGAEFSANTAVNGGIIYGAKGTVNIQGDVISSQSSGNGGAVCASGDIGSSLTVNIYGTVSYNKAGGNGGAVYIDNATVNIENSSGSSIIEYNSSGANGGAIYLANKGVLTVTGSNIVTFSNNTADTSGGAIYAGLGSTMTFSAELLFDSNKANNGDGGALWIATSTQLPTGTVTFSKNSAERTDTTDDTLGVTSGNGGAICIGGTRSSSMKIDSSYNYTFTSNVAKAYGGAIYTVSADVIFDGWEISSQNTAEVGGGFASSVTGRITLQNGTSVSNQKAPLGGAIYASEVAVNNSKMFSNIAEISGGAIYATTQVLAESADFTSNESRGTTETDRGGGAIYVAGNVSIVDSYLANNAANMNGAAILAYNTNIDATTTARIENSYFYNNEIANGNGGAVMIRYNRTSTITKNTFINNATNGQRDGGALSVEGKNLTISNCYFEGNYSGRFGGAVYFSQSSNTDPEASFAIVDSMFKENKSTGGATEGGGGAVYVATNTVSIKKCTFDENFLQSSSGNYAYGGAVYIDTTINPTGSDNDLIENSTFVGNYIEGGASGRAGGGAVAIRCQNATIRSCTLTDNASDYNGSAIYIKDGKVTISGTIALGNTNIGAYDIWCDSTVLSGGYNRIGIYGQGGGVTDFYSVTGNATDRSSYPHNTWMTLRSTFFSTNVLDVNERTDLGTNIPPYIGSTRHPDGQFRLLTLMLSEDASLPNEDRATNAIPYSRRQSFPAVDERGVNRRNPNIGIDIGAVFFDGTRPSNEQRETSSYSIAYIQISGVPNAIRRIGQTASLIAKVYYTNGRVAYGGSGNNDEPVTWSASPAGYLKVNADTGVITALRLTTGESYVTLKCETVRTDTSGNSSSAIARIKIDPALEFGALNNSPESGNSDVVQIIRDLRYDFEEYNMGYGLIDKNIEIVQSYNYQDIIFNIWGVNDAQAIATTAGNYQVTASSSNSLVYVVNVPEANEGAVTAPVAYLCSFSAEELKSILGYSLYSSILAADDTKLDSTTASKLFSVLKVGFEGENGFTLPVLGPDSSVNIADAMNKGALEVTNNSGGINIKLNLMLANLASSNNSKLEITESGKSDLNGAIIIPDGVNDGQISGSIVFPQKDITASATSTTTETKTTVNNNTQQASAQKSQEGGGGSGCSIGWGLWSLASLILFTSSTKKRR